MKFTDLATSKGLSTFLQEYHKQLSSTRNFPPLSPNKALHTAAPIFGFKDWHAMSPEVSVPFPTERQEIQDHPVFDDYHEQCDISFCREKDADNTDVLHDKILYLVEAIQNHGDNDECAWKHINHSFAAIKAGKTWMHGIDYRHPGRPYPTLLKCPEGEEERWGDFYRANFSFDLWSLGLGALWAKLNDAIDTIGVNKALLIVDNMAMYSPSDYYDLYDYKKVYG